MMLYQSGPVNDVISRLLGVEFKPAWLTNPDFALTAVMLLEIWNWTPFSFIIMLAGLSAIPKEPIEAAEILGASRWRIFWEVQLPLLRPVILLALVLRFLEAMAEFPKTWALFQGGPGTATETLPVYIFLTTWQYFQISKGAAMSYVVMMLMIVHRAAGDPAAAAGEARRSMPCTPSARAIAEAAGMTQDPAAAASASDRPLRDPDRCGRCVAFFPIYWIVATSFKIDTQWFAWPPVYFPDPPTLANYLNVWLGKEEYTTTQYAISSQKPLYSLRNSIVIATTSTLLAVLFGSMIAYGVSRYRILSEARMFQLLMLRMIPPIVVVAPLSLYYSALGLLDTMFGLILIYFLTSLPYAVWMTKSFIDEVPREIEQAAEILGASRWRTIFEIVLPLIRSGLVATFLFILILTWSEYLLAFILTKTEVVDAAGRSVEISGQHGGPRLRPAGRARGRHHRSADDRRPHHPQASRARLQLRHGEEIALARIELVDLHQDVRIRRRRQRSRPARSRTASSSCSSAPRAAARPRRCA